MKQTILLLLTLSLFSCKKDEEKKDALYPESRSETVAEGEAANLTPSQKLGKELFDGKGNCFSCHKPDQKVVGPSIEEIAKIYKEKNADMVAFLKGEGEPIVDPSQFAVMKTNLYITKNFTDEELKGIEDYMMSHIAKQAH